MMTSTIQDKKIKKIKPWTIILWLICWQLVAMFVNQQIFLVSPIKVIQRLGELIITFQFWNSIAFSLWRIVCGFLMGNVLGVLLAVLSSKYKVFEEILALPIVAIKSVPVASFIIILLIWFSSKNLAVIISFLMVLPIMYTSTFQGIQQVNVEIKEMALVFKMPVWKKIRYIYIPQISPYFLSASVTSMGLAWKSGIAGEVIGMPDGSIGEHLQQAKVYLDTPDVFAWTVVIVVLSILCEKVFVKLIERILIKLRK